MLPPRSEGRAPNSLRRALCAWVLPAPAGCPAPKASRHQMGLKQPSPALSQALSVGGWEGMWAQTLQPLHAGLPVRLSSCDFQIRLLRVLFSERQCQRPSPVLRAQHPQKNATWSHLWASAQAVAPTAQHKCLSPLQMDGASPSPSKFRAGAAASRKPSLTPSLCAPSPSCRLKLFLDLAPLALSASCFAYLCPGP